MRLRVPSAVKLTAMVWAVRPPKMTSSIALRLLVYLSLFISFPFNINAMVYLGVLVENAVLYSAVATSALVILYLIFEFQINASIRILAGGLKTLTRAERLAIIYMIASQDQIFYFVLSRAGYMAQMDLEPSEDNIAN
jgi:hypothetical protein